VKSNQILFSKIINFFVAIFYLRREPGASFISVYVSHTHK